MCKESGREFLSFVTKEIEKSIHELGLSIEEGQRDIDQMHEYYWENYTEMDQYGYENYDNQQALFHQISANEDARAVLHRYMRMRQTPFFGRVDFRFEDEEKPEIFYIGIGNFAKEAGQMPLIFDWRAPVSGLFYDFDKGPASYLAPMGELSGEITAKWQYKIRNGRMIYEFESDVKIDDEILKQELGNKGQEKLKNIIRTIQKEQNAIIRNTADRILVVQGAAGSGKTSIALHRIAYLLYHDRENLKSSNILILSPNGIFADYISQILPELGEENIREMTFDLFAYRQLRDTVSDCEEHIDYLERELKGLTTQEERKRTAYKQSKAFVNRMEGFIFRLEDELMDFRDVEYRGLRMSADEILRLFYESFAELPLLVRMEAVMERFVDDWETLRDTQMPEEDRLLVEERFFGMYETRDLYEIYRRFLRIEGLPDLPDGPIQERSLMYEDVYPILFLKYRLCRQHPDKSVRHLVVDEMQDYSWLQFAVLSRMFSCRMTILGDKAQSMDTAQSDALSFLPEIFGKKIRRIVINRCYRNTVEIASYANELLGIKDVELFERHGRPVEERVFTNRQGVVRAIAEKILPAAASGRDQADREPDHGETDRINTEPDHGETDRINTEPDPAESFETAAVITLTENMAKDLYRELKPILAASGFDTEHRLNCLDRNSKAFHKGLTVTTFYLSKGLEFDRVYLVLPRNTQGKEMEPLLMQAAYIGATRAMHELTVYRL